MRLLTWNIHKGIGGVDRRYSLERTVALIQHYRPDVLTLQEVDQGVPRSHRHHQTEELAERLGFAHHVFAPNVTLTRGCYGNATLSHYPIVQQRNVELTLRPKKARAALYTELRIPSRGHQLVLHLFNTHLGLSGVERRLQVRKLLASAPFAHISQRSRVLIAGDTNDWAGVLAQGRLFNAGFRCVTGSGRKALRTFPAWAPVGALDKVFVRGPVQLDHVLRPRLDLARRASDHRPVVIDITLQSQ
jgi:endonuclease/exonuclease/phosphatase family metal-dependent hydrolase